MNYSKNLRKATIAKRVIASWCVIAAVGSLVGGVSGYALKTHIIAKDEQKETLQTNEQVQSEFVVYGAYDNRIFTQEISLDWGAGDLDFTPLDCNLSEEYQEFTYYLCAGVQLRFYSCNGTDGM